MPVASVDPMASRMRRTFPAVGAALLALALVTGCAPEPAPTPTPTGFASDDEAFAAAEATYRAYVEAGNELRSDPNHTPTPESFLTGQALTDSLESQRQIEDAGVHVVGDTSVNSVRPDKWDQSTATITVCLGLSSVRVIDRSGADVTPAGRDDTAILQVSVIYAQPSPLIISSTAGQGGC